MCSSDLTQVEEPPTAKTGRQVCGGVSATTTEKRRESPWAGSESANPTIDKEARWESKNCQERHGVDPAGAEVDVQEPSESEADCHASGVGWVGPDGEADRPPARVSIRPAEAAAEEAGERLKSTRGRSEHGGSSAAKPAQADRTAGEPTLSYDPDAYYRTNLEAVRGTPWEPGTKIHYRNPRGEIGRAHV